MLPTLVAFLALAQADDSVRFFESKIRPVLTEHCHSCHGPKKAMASLRLDTRAGALAQGELGPIVVPGQPEKSVLLAAVKHQGELKMPPKGKLAPQQIADLEAWIKMGAPWPEPAIKASANDPAKHWAFQPVSNPRAPRVKNLDWVHTAVDRFILAGLEAKGLTPSPDADPRILLRRLSFDLIGLPPTYQQMSVFAHSWDAFPDDRQKLLEREVDRLLDSPQYGERWARHWLDLSRYADTKGYVFFEDKNFDWPFTYRDYVIRAFNDDLPYDRFLREQLAADKLGEPRALPALGFLTLGGRFMNNIHDVIDDRIDVVTRGLLGMTVTCARCHDHKYDPISQRDYYGLYGVFANSVEPSAPPLFEAPPQTEAYTKFDQELRVLEKNLIDFVKSKHEELVLAARKRFGEYLLAGQALRGKPSTEEFMLIADTNDLNPTMIVRYQKWLERRARGVDPILGPWFQFAALPESDFAAQAKQLFAKLDSASFDPQVAKTLLDSPPVSLKDLADRYGKLVAAAEDAGPVRNLVYGEDAPANLPVLPYGDLSLLPDRPSQGKLQALRGALEKFRVSAPGAPPRAHVLEDMATPIETHVFLRGNPNNKGPLAPRQMPAALSGQKPQPFQKGSGRLELAQEITRPENPLTARVLVNRVWALHFGAGLVTTPSDLGVRSDAPSHPELLDYLATRFMAEGWSIKNLHRLMVLSHTYQQASDLRKDTASIDPENRLLSRMPRRRLDFEATRDHLLFVAGTLDLKVGGPSVKDTLSPSSKRRTMYGFLDRLNVPGLYRAFDFPSPDATSAVRDTTTIAPQALFLMNHPLVLESAKGVARRIDRDGEKTEIAGVERTYQTVLSRDPSSSELALAQRYLKLAGGDPWQRLAHALMQTNEFVWVD